MRDYSSYNKKRLCFTDVSDFTDFQGIGSDPLYKRFESVKAVLRTCIDDAYKSFIAEPIYNPDDDTIAWYTDEWTESPRLLSKLTGAEKSRYESIREATVQHYREAVTKLEDEDLKILGGVMRFLSDDTVFCFDDKVVMVAWGMRYDTNKHQDIGSLMHDIPSKPAPPKIHQVQFSPGSLGTLAGESLIHLKEGEPITAEMIPAVTPADGYTFQGWDTAPLGTTVSGDMLFTAQYAPITVPHPEKENDEEEPEEEPAKSHRVRFSAGGHGKLKGPGEFTVPAGSTITAAMLPKVKSKWGYKFTGWDADPLQSAISGDTVFTAQYEKKKNWFFAIWPWLWKILLALLLLLLLLLLLRNCHGCSRHPVPVPIDDIDDRDWVRDDPNVGEGGGIYDPGNPYTPVPTPPDYRDILPPDQGVLPPIGDNDPIREEPGRPTIIANRLNVLMENEDKSIMDLARAFKQKYPGEQYQVVYYDDVVKRMQIVIPEAEREAIKQRLPQEFAPEYTLFVFDESMFESNYRPSDPDMRSDSKTWYLTAIGAFNAWETTTGTERVTVAVVDNGFNLRHKEFAGKVVMPYNVWKHSADITVQQVDHGSHVAGIAIALADNGSGLCGIAPKCKFMPVQVADEQGRMTITSVLDGVIYAIYQGADVINISLGGSFAGLDQYPERLQRELIDNHFKEEERIWNEVARIAETHKTILVAAAGNDNVLAGIEALQRPKNIIIVAAVDKNNRHHRKTGFSNYGEYSNVSAPGVDIYSCFGRGYRNLEGTSMASPIVAGSVALMKSINKDITAEQALCVLQSTGIVVDSKIGPMIQLDKALMKVKDGGINECRQEEAPEPSHGDVEITLQWGNINDLDLWCEDPNGEVIYFHNKQSRSGGKLEIDMNSSNSTTSETPIEHIYWPAGGAPSGTYTVAVHYYRQHNRNINQTPYTIKVKYGNQTETIDGTISSSDELKPVITFTLNPNGRGNSTDSDAARQQLINRREQLQREIDEINRSLQNR